MCYPSRMVVGPHTNPPCLKGIEEVAQRMSIFSIILEVDKGSYEAIVRVSILLSKSMDSRHLGLPNS